MKAMGVHLNDRPKTVHRSTKGIRPVHPSWQGVLLVDESGSGTEKQSKNNPVKQQNITQDSRNSARDNPKITFLRDTSVEIKYKYPAVFLALNFLFNA